MTARLQRLVLIKRRVPDVQGDERARQAAINGLQAMMHDCQHLHLIDDVPNP